MNNIGILASGRGTDMQAMIDAIKSKKLNANISVVISHNKNSYALERARLNNIKAVFIEKSGKSRESYDIEISEIIDKNAAGLILLLGYMKILSSWFVNKYKNRVMNVHPSLLPAYAGGMDLNVHRAVLERGCKYSGATLLFIDDGADTGPIIMQQAVKISDDETEFSLKGKVQKAEQELLLKAIPLYFEGKIKVENNKVRVK